MLFPTTIAGSLPKPAWLAQPNRLWAGWRLNGDALAEAQRDAVRLAVDDQERAGIDVVTDGEQSRRHFVHGFLEGLAGVNFAKMVRAGIRAGRYEVDVPTVDAPVVRTSSVFAGDAAFARGLTGRRLKWTLPGPMTAADTVFDAYYHDRRELAFAFAEALRREIAALAAAGVDIVQLDEPAFNVYLHDVERWGVAALDAAIAGAPCETAVHVCYGYGIEANREWKRSLGDSWDQYGHVLPLLANARVDEISIELAGSRVPPRVLQGAGRKRLAVGVVDVADDRVETAEEVARTLEIAARHVDASRIVASTNCGMAPMTRGIALAKIRALGAGAALARVEAAIRR